MTELQRINDELEDIEYILVNACGSEAYLRDLYERLLARRTEILRKRFNEEV